MPSVWSRGFVQQRGNSARAGHYVRYRGKTRIVQWHKVKDGNQLLVNNSNQSSGGMVNKKPKSAFFNAMAGGVGFALPTRHEFPEISSAPFFSTCQE
jgi:hypothetical protein